MKGGHSNESLHPLDIPSKAQIQHALSRVGCTSTDLDSSTEPATPITLSSQHRLSVCSRKSQYPNAFLENSASPRIPNDSFKEHAAVQRNHSSHSLHAQLAQPTDSSSCFSQTTLHITSNEEACAYHNPDPIHERPSSGLHPLAIAATSTIQGNRITPSPTAASPSQQRGIFSARNLLPIRRPSFSRQTADPVPSSHDIMSTTSSSQVDGEGQAKSSLSGRFKGFLKCNFAKGSQTADVVPALRKGRSQARRAATAPVDANGVTSLSKREGRLAKKKEEKERKDKEAAAKRLHEAQSHSRKPPLGNRRTLASMFGRPHRATVPSGAVQPSSASLPMNQRPVPQTPSLRRVSYEALVRRTPSFGSGRATTPNLMRASGGQPSRSRPRQPSQQEIVLARNAHMEALRVRAAAINHLPGMPQHLAGRIWEDLEDPKFRFSETRKQNHINTMLGALAMNSMPSGHFVDGDLRSPSPSVSRSVDRGSHACATSGQLLSDLQREDSVGCSQSLFDLDNASIDSDAATVSVALQLHPEANCNIERRDIIWKSIVALGQGSSAIVSEARYRSPCGDIPVVIKERRSRKDPDDDAYEQQIFAEELELCSRFTHRNIVFCQGGRISPPEDGTDFILFERCETSLSHYLACRHDDDVPNALWMREVLDIGISMLNALHWIHPDVTHGDLSSSNVLMKWRENKEGIRTMCVLLADFETARVTDRGEAWSGSRGTPAFMPPEDDDEAKLAIGHTEDWLHENRDVYSVGMVMFHAITGCCPFFSCCDHSQVNELAQLNRSRFGSVLPLPPSLSPPIADFIKDCWEQRNGNATTARNRLLQLKHSTPEPVLNHAVLSNEALSSFRESLLSSSLVPHTAAATDGEWPSTSHSHQPSTPSQDGQTRVDDIPVVHVHRQHASSRSLFQEQPSFHHRRQLLDLGSAHGADSAVHVCCALVPPGEGDHSSRLDGPWASSDLAAEPVVKHCRGQSVADVWLEAVQDAGLHGELAGVATPNMAGEGIADKFKATSNMAGGGIADIFKAVCGMDDEGSEWGVPRAELVKEKAHSFS